MIVGFDADQDCSHVAALAVQRGASFCCRYLKNLDVPEVRTLSAAGLLIVSIFESTAQRALGGAAAGTADGTRALTQARALGQPVGSAIYGTADFDEVASQDPVVLAYFVAFRAALAGAYRLGVYGNGALCQAVSDAGIADYTWLAGGSAMRGTKLMAVADTASLEQDVGDKRSLNLGINIDSDVANFADFGGWSVGVATGSVVKSTPTVSKSTPPVPDITVATALRTLRTAVQTTPDGAKQLQAAVGAEADGFIGKLTLAALGQYLASVG
jgi:hypothetical protein